MDCTVHVVTKSQTQLSDFHFTSLLPPYPNPSFQQPEHPLHSMCMLSYFSRVRLFETQWIKACQAPPSKGFSRQECWSGLPCPSPRDYLDPGIKSASLLSPALADGLFTTSATWEAPLLTVSQSDSSGAQSCPTLCDPMDCSTPHLPVHHQPSELTQTHVRVGDAIQPSRPLSSPSPPAPNPSQHQGLSQ